MDNPWKVDSIQAFSCLKCPECSFNTKEEHLFQDHAVKNHPSSSLLFDKSDRLIKISAKSGAINDNLTEEVGNSLKRPAENIECTESEAKKAKSDSDHAAETSQNKINDKSTIQAKNKNKNMKKDFVRGYPKNLKATYRISSDLCRSEYFMKSADLKDGIEERLKCVICDENGQSYDTVSDVQAHVVIDHIGQNTHQIECWNCKCDTFICELRDCGSLYECPKCLIKIAYNIMPPSHASIKVVFFQSLFFSVFDPKVVQKSIFPLVPVKL